MNYPVWYLPGIGGGTLIALIAVVHVFISHFAVGGGLYLVLAERKGLREKNPGILDFTRRHTKFFLLVTMVAGGLTGVGIWFIISLVQPAATSLLIHTFVFGWAAEWVFFTVEIVALLVYYYTFGRMEERTHQAVGWVYFIAAWLSLFLINGIINFMLTPGDWLADRNFWSGFFNPSFWPGLFFRSCIAFLLAGVYAFLTTSLLKDLELKKTMTRFTGRWVFISCAAGLPFGLWYRAVLPNEARLLVDGASPTIARALEVGQWALAALILLSALLVLLKPRYHSLSLSLGVLACSFLLMGSFEWTREAARRPFVINGVLYSNSIAPGDVEGLSARGMLASARWAGQKDVHEESLLEAGEDLFRLQCYACHTVGGINNDIAIRTASMSYPVMLKYLETIHERRYFMPPFAGNAAEKRALAAFLVAGLHGKPIEAPAVAGGPGQAIFEGNCAFCHDEELVRERIAGWPREKVRRALDALSSLDPAMPDFEGSPAEKDLLADYLASPPAAGAVPAHHDPGEDVFESHCAMCHSLEGSANPLLPKIRGWQRDRLRGALDRLEQLSPAMPPLSATTEEKEALADFLTHSLQGGQR